MKFSRVWLVTLAACNFDPPPPPIIGDDGGIDAPDDDIDAPENDDRHLLITEIAVLGGTAEAEFFEVFNPTSRTIDLTNYYLSDEPTYWKLPGHLSNPPSETITLFNSDFLINFPPGTMIAPNQVLVIAMHGNDFAANFPADPLDFTIVSAIATATPMVVVVDPPAGDNERLTNTGEMLVLFEWDGLSDTVHDVDMVVHGNTADPLNLPGTKAGVDGPDADAGTTSYLTDALSITQLTRDMLADESYKRIAAEDEVQTGGNGITGHDESSEKIGTTWAISNGVTPGIVPPGL